jgi:subtilase family serine protease
MTRRLIASTLVALVGGLLTAFLVFGQAAATAGSRHAAINVSGVVRSLALTPLAGGAYRLGEAASVPAKSADLGALAGSTPLQLVVGLKPSNPTALATFATEVSTPGTAEYKHYLTVSEFATKFGATPAAIALVRTTLAADGLTVGATSANNLSVQVSGIASTVEKAFSVPIARYKLADGRLAFGNTAAPVLPASIAHNVSAVIGLDDLNLAHPLGLSHLMLHHVGARSARSASERTNSVRPLTTDPVPTGAASACTAASGEASSEDGWDTPEIAQAYDYNPLYTSGNLGQGVTVGIFELEPSLASDITTFEQCDDITTSVKFDEIDGGDGTFTAADASDEDGIETDLDIENIIGLAPRVSVLVYQAPNTDAGLIDNYTAMVDNSAISVISTSWGECESENGSAASIQENTLFQQAAAEGKSIAAAAGDNGAEDCALPDSGLPVGLPAGPSDEPTPAVDDPASQPFVTGAGGTTLSAIGDPESGTAPTEVVWNAGPAEGLAGLGGAGGGGVSATWPMPSYQTDAAKSLNVINSESSATTCTADVGDCREVPDVTASADPDDGYVIYWDGGGAGATEFPAGWETIGGTSGAAPLWASVFAMADADQSCSTNGPIGFANPDLYGAASVSSAAYAKEFNDITSGNNDLYGTNDDEFAAGTGYDMASGLGSPIAANLVPALCAEVTPPTTTTPTVTETQTVTTTQSGTTTTITNTTTDTTTSTVTTPGTTQTQTVTTPGTTQTETVTTAGQNTPTPGPTQTIYEYTTGGCGKTLGFVVKPHNGRLRDVKTKLYINSKLTRTYKGHALKLVHLAHPKHAKFRVTLVSTLSNGEVVGQVLQFNGCTYYASQWVVLKK